MGFFTRQPALWIEVIRTGLLMAILFGLHLSTEQFGAVMVFIGALALALVQSQVTPQAPKTIDDLKKYIGKADPAVIDKAGVQIKTTDNTIALLIGALAFGALLAGPAMANPKPLSFDRLSGGLTAQAALYSNGTMSGDPAPIAAFAPKAWLSYGMLDEVSAHASYQHGVGAMRVNEAHAGGAVRLLREDPVRVSVGVDAVHYSGEDSNRLGAKDVVEYSLRFSKVLKRSSGAPRIGIQFQPAYVPENQNWAYRLGLNWTAFGGKAVIQ